MAGRHGKTNQVRCGGSCRGTVEMNHGPACHRVWSRSVPTRRSSYLSRTGRPSHFPTLWTHSGRWASLERQHQYLTVGTASSSTRKKIEKLRPEPSHVGSALGTTQNGGPTRENESGEVRGLLPGDGRNESWARMPSRLVTLRPYTTLFLSIPHGAAIAFPTALDTLRALGFAGAPTPVSDCRYGIV